MRPTPLLFTSALDACTHSPSKWNGLDIRPRTALQSAISNDDNSSTLRLRIMALTSQAARNLTTHLDLDQLETRLLRKAEMTGRCALRFLNRSADDRKLAAIARRLKRRFESGRLSWDQFAEKIRRLPSKTDCESIATKRFAELGKLLVQAMTTYFYRIRNETCRRLDHAVADAVRDRTTTKTIKTLRSFFPALVHGVPGQAQGGPPQAPAT
jgi:hypothetical protein